MLERLRQAAALVVAACGLGAAPAQAASYTYFSSASVAIPDYDGSTECGTSLTRSLTVSNTFAIGDMNVGVQISHAHRDDMAIYVLSPAGTSVTLAYRSGSNATDINARFDDEAASAITLNGHNATNGYPEEEWRPVGSLSDFDGENVNGVWQLRICDVDPTRTGTFRSFRLEVTDGPPAPPAGGGGGSSTYSEFFANTAIYSAGSTQFDNWEPFRTGSPSSGIRSVTIGGSRDTTGRTCSDPALAQQIMDNFRNATGAGGNSVVEGSVSCGGFIWNTGNCAVSGVGIEFNAASSAKVCDGGADHYTLRPHIGNANWGGIAGATASAPSQTMTVSYTTTDPLEVTSTADTDTIGTLRYAINHANANTGDDDITFDIAGAGLHRITLGSALPVLTDDGIDIDGSSQTGASCGQLTTGTPHDLRIVVDGNGGNGIGFEMAGNSQTLRGLAIVGFAGHGIKTTATTGSILECLHVGIEADGTTANANARNNGSNYAIRVLNSIDPVVRNNLVSGNDDDANDTGLRVGGSSGSGALVTGNVIGLDENGTAALGNGGGGILVDGNAGSTTIGGTTAATRNIVSGNGGHGIALDGVGPVSILGNYIGLNAAGTATLPNGSRGIEMFGVSGVTIGNGGASGRNVIAGNLGRAIHSAGVDSGITVSGNHIGTDATGNTPLVNAQGEAANARDAIVFNDAAKSAITVSDNVVGGHEGAGIEFYNSSGSGIAITGNSIGIGADGSSDISGAGGFGEAGILIGGAGTGAIGITIGGAGAGQGNLIANAGAVGISLYERTGISVLGNTMRNNAWAGISVWSNGAAAIHGNSIHDNGTLGIDLGYDGVTPNDGGDSDAGANDLLNFPLIDDIIANGTTAFDYDLSLDVPVHGNGYRIEFFKSAFPKPTNGEGEVYLGSVDVAGPGVHAGSLTALVPVGVGESISATTTRKTATGFDITSEFSVNATSSTADPARIAAAKSVEVIDDGLIGGDDTVAIPGATLRYTITIRNDGAGAADAGSTVVTDQIPSNGSFKVDDFGGAPGIGPLGVSQGSPPSGLTYSYVSLASSTDDLEFSDDSGATWTYAPMDSGDGTDPGVTHIRIRPDGPFSANTGMPPSIDLKYEVVLF